jgi:nicotinamidase-related amidase
MAELKSLHFANTALLVMDYQTVVLENFLPKDAAASVLEQASKLLAAARVAGIAVIHITVGFRPGYPEISPNNGLFSWIRDNSIFTPGSESTRIHAAVAPQGEEPVIVKHRVGAFTGTELDMVLRARRIDTLLLAGVTTSGVVLSTLRQAFDLDYSLAVVRDCCADSEAELHSVLFEKLFPVHALVASTKEIVGLLGL